jgi:phosphohistidine phosphatase
MTLWVVRHGKAVERSLRLRDSRRPLTAEGRERFAGVVRALRRSRTRFDLLLHSPLLRAVETAEILVPLLREDAETAVTPHLARAPGPALLAELRDAAASRRRRLGAVAVAVVGHEPWLSELVSLLVTGSTGAAERFPLKKGGVVRLEGDPAPGAMALVGAFAPADLAAAER